MLGCNCNDLYHEECIKMWFKEKAEDLHTLNRKKIRLVS